VLIIISVYKQTEYCRYTKGSNMTHEIYSHGMLLMLQICGWQNTSLCKLAVFIVHCCLFYRIKQQYTANVTVLGTKCNRFLSVHSQVTTCFASCELSLLVSCRGRVNQSACSKHRKKQFFKYMQKYQQNVIKCCASLYFSRHNSSNNRTSFQRGTLILY
jgi:hypothetical protein